MRKTVHLLAFLTFTMGAYAQITSTFNTDTEGWTCSDNNLNDAQTVNYFSTGGNPGGYVSATKTSTSQPYYWTSPANFGGNIAYFSYGQDLSFDIQVNYAGSFHFGTGDVQIRTVSGSVLVYTLPSFPAQSPAWSTFTIRLDETADWKVGSTTGPLATQAQMLQYLTSVHSFRIGLNYRSGVTAFTGAIDNVVLNQRSVLTPPSVSSITPTSGNAGSTITISGNNFDPVAANNTVYFGGVAATITAASATSLTVTVPNGAQYGSVSVNNKTTGLANFSDQPFIPTFEGGGRIIPASLDPKADVLLSSSVEGFNVADIDSDGWNDLLVGVGANSVLVYRNLGLGGDITTASFASPLILTGAGNTGGMFIRDVDGDGKMDIITGYTSGSITNFATYRNTSTPGNPSFEAVELWPGLVYSGSFSTIVDVDGDGLVDFIGQHRNGSVNVDFWIAQNMSTPGNIQFGSSLSYFGSSALDAGSGATAGDLDNDGKPEFVVSHGFAGNFSILKNNSTPGIISLANLGSISSGNSALSVADFNLDGKNDIVWKSGSTVRIRLNSNSGSPLDLTDFTNEVSLTGDLSNYGGMSLGDINGDGKIDIAASDNGDVGVFENVYSGGVFDATAFVPTYQYEGSGASTYPTSPVVADLNGDNKPELLVGVTNTSPNRISIYENKNIHTPVISVNTITPLKGPIGSTVTITGSHFSTTPSENKVWFGGVQANVLSSSENEITVEVPAGAGYERVSVTVGVLTSFYHLPFNITFGQGTTFDNTTFLPPVSYPLTGADYDVEVADMNADGKPEVVAESRIVTGIIRNYGLSYRNDHTSGLITASSLALDDTTSTSARNLKILDIDSDGLPDILSAEGIYRNTSTSTEISYEPNVTLAASSFNHTWADFNQDGKIDVATTYPGGVYVFENRVPRSGPMVTGTYASIAAGITITKPAGDGGLVAGDFDGDGLPEFASTNPSTDNMRVWRNTGSYRIAATQFAVVGDLTTGDNPGRIYIGDLDVDGKMDLLVYHGTGTNATMLSIFHNTSIVGNISFTRIDLTNPSATTVATIADLDGDGKPEIITTSETGNRFSIFKNVHTSGALTAASFAAPFNTTVTAPRGITTGDINLDGKPEIILTRAAGLLVVYENLVPTVSMTITSQPGGIVNRCPGDTYPFSTDATGTTNITFQWQKFNSGANVYEDLITGGPYGDVTDKNLVITNMQLSESGDYRCKIMGDFATTIYSDTATLIVNPLPPLPTTVNGISCGPGAVVVSAFNGSPGEYRWYGGPVGGEPIPNEENDSFITPMLSGTTTYYVSLVNSFCESARVPVDAIISTIPNQPVITSNIPLVGNTLTICSTTSLTLSVPSGFASYLWSDGSTLPDLTVTASGTYSVIVTNADGCDSPVSTDVTITVQSGPCSNSAPVIATSALSTTIGGNVSLDLASLLSDADGNLVLSSLAIVQQPSSGAPALINGTNLQIDYSGISFTGTDVVTIQVCDAFGECATQQFEITVIGEIEIFTGISPNNDGKNDFFNIQYIDLIEPENTVTIYNRWGDIVFEVSNYNNNDRVFRGVSDNGKDLPTGTYFYKIEFQSGLEAKTGFLSLKR
jgi:gliding motility-associated-like protein